MSGRASEGSTKRQKEQDQEEEKEEEDAPASLEMTVQPQPLTLLALVKANFDTLVCMQLCNPQGISLVSFVCLAPRVSHPLAGAPVYDMSLTHAERLCVVGCGFKGKLVRLLSLGVGRHFEPQRNWGACRKMMQSVVRRVAAGLAAAVRDKAAKEAEELCASGQFAAAVVPLQLAIDLGDLPSLALKAWLHIDGREGIADDKERGLALAEEGARLGCHHCQGVVAWCYLHYHGFAEDDDHYERLPQSLELARESSGKGSRYGQLTLGELYRYSFEGGLDVDMAQSVAFYRLAAAQGLDEAQCKLGYMYYHGYGIARDLTEALRLYQLAAAQGHPHALYSVAECHQDGYGVAADVAEAIRWYRRAQAAGHPMAEDALYDLGA
jgi:TPR repeat protein